MNTRLTVFTCGATAFAIFTTLYVALYVALTHPDLLP